MAAEHHAPEGGAIIALLLREAAGGNVYGHVLGYVTITYVVVVFSVLVQGLSIERLVRRLVPCRAS